MDQPGNRWIIVPLLLAAARLTAACSLIGLFDPDLLCDNNSDCDWLVDPTDPCQMGVCNPETGGCEIGPSDKDNDSHISVDCGGDDCDDNDNQAYPGAPERCNFKDDNCDGSIDEGLMVPSVPYPITHAMSPSISAMSPNAVVAYENEPATEDAHKDVRAQKLDIAGVAVDHIDEAIWLSDSASDSRKPAISGKVGDFLAVWNDALNGIIMYMNSKPETHGRELSDSVSENGPKVSWNSDAGAYGVVWDFVSAGMGYDITFVSVSDSGVTEAPTQIVANPVDDTDPKICSDGFSWFVAYSTHIEGCSEDPCKSVSIMKLDRFGAAVGAPVSLNPDETAAFDLACHGGGIYVIWTASLGGTRKLLFTSLNLDLQFAVDPTFVELDPGVVVAAINPAIASAGDGRAFAVWEQGRDVVGVRINSAGQVLDQPFFVSPDDAYWSYKPSVAWHEGAIVTWQDDEESGKVVKISKIECSLPTE